MRPTVAVDGRIVGTWRRTVKSGSVAVDLFAPLAQRAEGDALAACARRYGEFLGVPVTVSPVHHDSFGD